jgi:hypothetical protein
MLIVGLIIVIAVPIFYRRNEKIAKIFVKVGLLVNLLINLAGIYFIYLLIKTLSELGA